MNAYLLPGIIGLLLGLALHWAGFSRPAALRDTLAVRCCHPLRSGLYLLGVTLLLTALLCWLAVIDVDAIEVLPLSAGVLAGGAVFGVAAGLCGFTPLTAFAGIGGGPVWEALCTAAGCLLGAWCLPLLDAPLAALAALPPLSPTTLFRTTLDEPFLLGGGFLGQGCLGLLLMTLAACIPSNRCSRPMPEITPATESGQEIVPEAAEAATEEAPAPEEDKPAGAEAAASDDSAEPEEDEEAPAPPQGDAAQDTFIALLPGEEALVVDTLLEESAEPAAPQPPADEATGIEAPEDAVGETIPDDAADDTAKDLAP